MSNFLCFSNTTTMSTTNNTTTNQTQATATIKSRPNIMPSSYMYTSSSGLLNRGNNENNKPTPPPTLPKYTSSFNAGSGVGGGVGGSFRDRDKDNIGGSYRLSSLDRLGLRQKYLDQGQGHAVNNTTTTTTNTVNGTITPTNGSDAQITSTQSKREMFFNSTSSIESIQPPPPPAVNAKDPNRLANKIGLDKPPEPPTKPVLSENKDESNNNGNKEKECVEIVKEKPKPRELDGYVGFANLPNQVYRKAVKKGFEFTLMVVGESGLGKSTLINSMFLTDIYHPTEYPGPTQRLKKTVAVETTKVMLKENGVNLLLTVVDTPGFGDAVDNSNCWLPIVEYIESKYEDYLNSEARVTRKQVPDQRVHCCLYFIQPSGHGLKSLDIEFMKRLCDKVNIVPVISKADTLTSEECALFKKQIMNEIVQHKIKLYEFPDTIEEDEEHKINKSLRDRVPFAVVGSNVVIEIDGKKVRGRRYPWGIAEVENLEHCDFIALRNMVIRSHLQDLKDVTNNVHYENYRCRKLAGLGVDGKTSKISNKNPLAQMDEEKREHDLKLKKMEAEMEQVFEMKVREKVHKLKESEAELTRRHEATKKSLEQQAKELEEKRKQFELEKQHWEQDNQITIEELRRRSLEGSRETVDGKKEKKKKGLF